MSAWKFTVTYNVIFTLDYGDIFYYRYYRQRKVWEINSKKIYRVFRPNNNIYIIQEQQKWM